MAKNPKRPVVTKKHLAREEREARQRRYILIGASAVLIAVVALLVYGVLEQTVLAQRRAVAMVNGEKITAKTFQDQARYVRFTMVDSAMRNLEIAQMFGNDPQFAGSIVPQLQQLKAQMDNTASLGQSVLDSLIDLTLVEQQAEEMGLTVTDEEVQQRFEEAFGFYEEGTPTPSPTVEALPTSTLSAFQQTVAAPTETPLPTETPVVTLTEVITETPVLTATATATLEAPTPTPEGEAEPTAEPTLTPTPTPYTREAFEELSSTRMQEFADTYGITEEHIRYVIRMEILREKVKEAVVGDLPRTQEQVWARHILVEDEATAEQVLERLEAGEDFCDLAAELSQDTSNAQSCGDLDWFPRGVMDAAFEEAAFALDEGEVSEPVESAFGWHLIQLIGHEDRPLTPTEYNNAQEEAFQEWVIEQREAAEVETYNEVWMGAVPLEPTMPAVVDQFIQQMLQAQQEQLLPNLEQPPVDDLVIPTVEE